jgi:hypothetical protein
MMFAQIRTFFVSMKASRAYGRALRLQAQNKHSEALDFGRSGLSLLAQPNIQRHHPWALSVLAFLTMLVERLAYQAGEEGASNQDLADSLMAFKAMRKETSDSESDYHEEIRYLESKLVHQP